MRVAGLFAGIGGFEAGLNAAGHHTELFCEIWDPARAVLAAEFPNVPIESDVAAVGCLPATIDLITAGFPCQDLSQAGLTAGIGGRRSGLVDHVFRIIDKNDVPVVVLENVSFMLHLDRGTALERILGAFEARGYRWAYRVVNSLGFLPQRRERVLFVASKGDLDPSGVLFADEATSAEKATHLDTHAHGFYWTEGVRGLGWAPDAVPTLKNGSTVGIASPPAILLPSGDVVTPDIRDAERLQGFPTDWTKSAETVARPSIRWSLVGNAVTVPVAEWLGRRLTEAGRHLSERDSLLSEESRWPRAARYDGHRRYRVEINAFPVWKDRPALAEFLKFEGKPLSVRATTGFLARTERSTLRFATGFRERVRRHLDRMRAGVECAARPGFAIAAE